MKIEEIFNSWPEVEFLRKQTTAKVLDFSFNHLPFFGSQNYSEHKQICHSVQNEAILLVSNDWLSILSVQLTIKEEMENWNDISALKLGNCALMKRWFLRRITRAGQSYSEFYIRQKNNTEYLVELQIGG